MRYVSHTWLSAIMAVMMCATSSASGEDLSATFDQARQLSQSTRNEVLWYSKAHEASDKLFSQRTTSDSVSGKAFSEFVRALVVTPRGVESEVRYQQTQHMAMIVIGYLGQSFKMSRPVEFANENEMRVSSIDLLQCALVVATEMRAALTPDFSPLPVYANVAPILEPGETVNFSIRSGMDPMGIPDVRIRDRYIALIKKNSENALINAVQADFRSHLASIARLAPAFVSNNLFDVTEREALNIANLVRLIQGHK